MPVDIGTGFKQVFLSCLLGMSSNPGVGTTVYNGGIISNSSSGGGIYIMSGTMPLNINTVTSYSAISANILIAYPADTTMSASTTYNTSVAGSVTATLGYGYVAASATGTATWFLGMHRSSDTILQAMMGTVGVTGSGADLTMPNVNVISGSLYRLSGLNVTVPTTW